MFSMTRRHSTERLIWEYLDGDITPSRATRLSKALTHRPAVRKRFVESAVMHGMLYAYYQDKQTGQDIDIQVNIPRKRRAGKPSAA